MNDNAPTFINGLITTMVPLFNAIVNPINLIFAVVMLFLFIRYRNRPASSQLLPAILVGIGILGTFTGIFIGLLNFNVGDIKGSVPQLLEGLKIAFFTSIIGLVLSAWIKVKSAIQIMKLDDTKEKPTAIDDLSNTFKNILTELHELRVEQKEMLLLIGKSLIGDAGITISTQFQKLKVSIEDKYEPQFKILNSIYVSLQQISTLFEKQVANSIDYSGKLDEIMGLLSELKEVSRDLYVAVTLAPELEKRFSHLIENSDNLIDVVTDNKNKIDKITTSITDSYADGVLMILDKMIGIVRDIDKRQNIPIEKITNNIKDYLKTNIGDRSLSEIMDNIEAIEISTSQIVDKLDKIKKT